MDKQQFTDLLNTRVIDLRSFGIKQIGLFGSVSRNEATDESDLDVLLDFAPQKKNVPQLLQNYRTPGIAF